MFTPGQTVVVGVSGGPDSVALLHALAELRSVLDLRLVAAHLNHGFRGAESDDDAECAAALADSLGVPCHSVKMDVPALKKRRHCSAQEAARTARRAVLRRIAASENADRIALGHTQDDRVETLLLNLLRGTGPEGLQGFPPVAPPIIRPLYDVRRIETETYCAAHHLYPRRDSSNEKTDYRRNRVRLELLPALASYYNLNVSGALLRMSELVTADNALLDAMAAGALQNCLVSQSSTVVALDCEKLSKLDIALRRRVLRQAVETVRGTLQNIPFAVIDDALRHVAQKTHFAANLPVTDAGETKLTADVSGLLWIEKITPPTSPLAWEVDLILPEPGDAARLAAQGWKFRLCEFHDGAAAQRWRDANFTPEAALEAERNAMLFAVPISNAHLTLTARSWKPGDRMIPTGMTGSKKLQDVFTDLKIPAAQRHLYPVVADYGGTGAIFAVVGLRASENTARVFREWNCPLWIFQWQRIGEPGQNMEISRPCEEFSGHTVEWKP